MERTYTINYEFGKGYDHRFINYNVKESELERVLKYWLDDEYQEDKMYYYFYINIDTRIHIYQEFYWYAYNKYKKLIGFQEGEY